MQDFKLGNPVFVVHRRSRTFFIIEGGMFIGSDGETVCYSYNASVHFGFVKDAFTSREGTERHVKQLESQP